MKNTEVDAPPAVVAALEQATAPADLGRAYQTITDWKKRRSPWTLGRAFHQILATAVLIASGFLLVLVRGIEVSDFWRGALLGAVAMQLFYSAKSWSSHRSPVATSFLNRVDIAIERWRHAVPAMRDFPK